MWIELIVAIVPVLALVLAAAFAYGSYRWQVRTETLREELRAHESATPRDPYEPAQLENLPAPVERYLRKVLDPGQRPIRSVRIRHQGEFNMAESEENWAPFTSRQWTITDRAGFLWDARIRMLPGVPVHVHDGYVAGRGILEARLLGLIPVAGQEASPELAQGDRNELHPTSQVTQPSSSSSNSCSISVSVNPSSISTSNSSSRPVSP